MQYFKHYHNASSAIMVQKVINDSGLIGYAHWFLLLELMCEKFDGSSILIKLTIQEIATKLRVKPARVHSIITRLSELSDNQAITKLESSNNRDNLDGFIIIIRCPILIDLQDRDFKHARTKRVSSDAKIKNKNKDKEEDKDKENTTAERLKSSPDISYQLHEKLNDDFLIPFLATVKIETQEAWFKTYEDDAFIKTELMKACTWIINNKSKAPKKNHSQFFSNWLSRGWETYRKTLKTNPGTSGHYQKLLDENPYRGGAA